MPRATCCPTNFLTGWKMSDWHTRYRRIIDSYRTALQTSDPDVCHLVDARMSEFGEHWVCADDPVDVNALVSAREISETFAINPWNVMDWSRRHPDKVPKHKVGVRTLFRLGDVLAYHALANQ